MDKSVQIDYYVTQFMNAQQIRSQLNQHREEVHRLGIRSLGLFGSVARGEAGPESDVDLLVEFDHSVSLFELFRAQHDLERILGVDRVDLVMKSAIKPAYKDSILDEVVNVA